MVGKKQKSGIFAVGEKHNKMVNRKIYNYLKDFFLNDKKSLLVTGARQVGKTYAIRKVGETIFKHFVEFNFIKNPKLKTIFANPLDTNDILLRLSAMTDTKLEAGNTLIFFDEVQACMYSPGFQLNIMIGEINANFGLFLRTLPHKSCARMATTFTISTAKSRESLIS